MADRFAGLSVEVRPGDDLPRAMWPFEQAARGVRIEFSEEWPKWAQRNYLIHPFQFATDKSIPAHYVPDETPWLPLPASGFEPGTFLALRAELPALPGRPAYTVEVAEVEIGRPRVYTVNRAAEGVFEVTLTEGGLSVATPDGLTCRVQVRSVPWNPRPLQVPYPGETCGRRLVVGAYPLRGLLT